MKAKDFVKQKYPKARAERHVQGRVKGMQKAYWLIRPEPHVMYIGSGDTESKAWKNAKDGIIQYSTEPSNEGNAGTQKSPFGPGA